MGLDMYLYKKTYVKHWEHNGDDNYKVSVTKAGKPVNIDPKIEDCLSDSSADDFEYHSSW